MNNESAPSKLSRTPIAVALAMICCFLWGSAFPCIKIGYKLFEIPADSPASQIFFAGIRFFIAGIMVIAVGSIGEKKLLLPTKRAVPKILSLSLFQTILQYIFFYIGLANTSGVKASVIEGTSAFICIIISALIFRMEKLTPAKIIGCLIGTAGIVVINLDSSLLSKISFMGDGFVFISIVAYSVSSVLIKRFSASENPVMLSGWQFLLGGAVMIVAGAIAGGSVGSVTAEGLLMLLYLAFISACAYSLWALLLKHNPVSKIAVFGFMNPVFGVLLSAFLLGETEQAFRLEAVIALLLIAAGIFIVNKKSEAD
ncbi:MAG: DMT family transporter [Ruminiclostridium sp.]